jgi:hypothetical protein
MLSFCFAQKRKRYINIWSDTHTVTLLEPRRTICTILKKLLHTNLLECRCCCWEGGVSAQSPLSLCASNTGSSTVSMAVGLCFNHQEPAKAIKIELEINTPPCQAWEKDRAQVNPSHWWASWARTSWALAMYHEPTPRRKNRRAMIQLGKILLPP